MLSERDEADLIWFFAEGGRRAMRSTFGATLERAQQFAYNSAGKRIARADPAAWHVMAVSQHREEPSYTPDDTELIRTAAVSRRLLVVEARHAAVLEAYYGDIGARWARTRAGRICSLYPFTAAGAGLLAQHGHRDTRRDERLAQLLPNVGREKRQRLQVQAEQILRAAAAAWEATGAR